MTVNFHTNLPPPSPRKEKPPNAQNSLKRASVAEGGRGEERGANCIALGSPDVTSYMLQVDFNDDVVFEFAKFSKNFLVYSEKPWTPPPPLNSRQPRIKTC